MPHAPGPSAQSVARGVAYLLVTSVFWSTTPLLVRFFAGHCDVWSQNAFRYLSGAAFLALWTGLRRTRRTPLTSEQWRALAWVAGANLVMQSFYGATYYHIFPAVGSLIVRLNIVFVAVLSFALQRDERRVIRSPRFLIGSCLALAGVACVIAGRDPELLEQLEVTTGQFWLGVGFALGLALSSSVYALSVKRAVRIIAPAACFDYVCRFTALGLAGAMLAFGRPASLIASPSWVLGLMALSAVTSIAIAHTCYYAALRHVKAVVATSVMQLNPVLTCVMSAAVFGDWLAPVQMLGAAGAICGAWLAAMAQARLES